MNVIRGLGAYPFECLIIYMKSKIRGTTLNACETCYNIKENEYRLLESYEERLFIEALKTGSKCPRAIMYLDLGVCPARFIIKKYKLNFLHYILNQPEESLMKTFFEAQMNHPSKGDWVSEMKNLIIEWKVANTFEEVRAIKKNQYEKIVNEKVKAEAFQYLKKKIKSKGSSIKYGDRLEMQDYMKPNKVLTFADQIELFSYRSDMNDVNLKFKNIEEYKKCVCNEDLNNIHLFQCNILNNDECGKTYTYEELLNGTLHQQKDLLNIMKKNLESLRKISKAA